jgi:hypothetical protein
LDDNERERLRFEFQVSKNIQIQFSGNIFEAVAWDAGSAGVDSIAYRPEPGFKGSDAFVVREGHGKGKPGDGIATVRIYVQVE